MPIDFIDQLSKFEKEPYWTSEGRLSLVRLLTSLPIKIYKPKMLYFLMVKLKIHDQAKAILENNKGKPFQTVLRDQKRKIQLQLTMTEC
jgi:predicted transcriptional regulator